MIHDKDIYERLAREILMVDEQNRSLTEEYRKIIESGLSVSAPSGARGRDVLIIGAGIAGLLAGKLLKDAGYNVTIVEANDNRIGGRIKTFHTTPDGEQPFSDPNQYAEAGAMRIPTSHELVQVLISKLDLSHKLQPFYNVDVLKDNTLTPAQRTWIKTNGMQQRLSDYGNSKLPAELLGFSVPEAYSNKTAQQLLDDALAPVKSLIDKKLSIEEQIAGWKQIIATYDDYSMFRYLRECYKDERVVQYIGTLQNLTSRLFLSFIHSFVDTFYITPDEKYVELNGGNWQLPYALLPYLQENIVMNARAVEIRWAHPSLTHYDPKTLHRGRPGVYVRTVNEPSTKRGHPRPGRVRFEREFTADYLLITIPFSALRFVDVVPQFSYGKHRAIIELHYDAATKVLLEFSERFWEWNEDEWYHHLGDTYRGHNSYGGGTITDGPNRFIYYPSHKANGSRGGVILASYSWADDANRWDSIPAEDRYIFALNGLTDIYGPGIKRFFTGCGRTESWMENFYSFGEAAVFTPGQVTALHPYVSKPEGPIHFAGEHTSMKHAWIEGAIESAVRAAKDIHEHARHDRR
ncbi:MAG: FAD-dependent oxidoreductase [Chloroflexi bacterium]|nr:FAD-dependent oxidoreductase [Chloroflexota bacterium]